MSGDNNDESFNKKPCSWRGTTRIGLNESITEINKNEIQNLGVHHAAVIALLRSYGNSINHTIVRSFSDFIGTNMTRPEYYSNLKFVAGKISVNQPFQWVAVNDIFSRTLGRKPNYRDCDFKTSTLSENITSDCYMAFLFSRGFIDIHDLNHWTRSTTEYIEFNESPKCVYEYPSQHDPHAIGEYVTEIYRILLRRRPTKREMGCIIYDYYDGDTRLILAKLAKDLRNSVDITSNCDIF